MHQVMADASVRFLGRHVARGRYPFSFQAAKHALHRRIIPAVSTTAHALAHAVTPEPLTKLTAAHIAPPDPSETAALEACPTVRKPCPAP